MAEHPEIRAAVIVLAAGDSTRMGRPKALLPWLDKRLIDHVLETARAGGCSSAHVVLGRDAAEIRERAKLADANVIVNEHPEQGQISSLKLGMSALDFSTDCCVVWPVDVPLVKPQDVRALIDAYAAMRASLMRIFIPTFEGKRGHPMLVDIGFRQPFIDLPPSQSARDVVIANLTQVQEVETDNPGVVVDVDTPGEYQAALERFGP